jgi:hypothetical protein
VSLVFFNIDQFSAVWSNVTVPWSVVLCRIMEIRV